MYVANNLVIPQFIYGKDGKEYEVTKIADGAFNMDAYQFVYGDVLCNLTGTLTLPKSLIEIGNYAFDDCTITGELVIPEKVTTIGLEVFCEIQIRSLVFSDVSNGLFIGDECFEKSKKLDHITFINLTASADPVDPFNNIQFGLASFSLLDPQGNVYLVNPNLDEGRQAEQVEAFATKMHGDPILPKE
jgi:hypothetical protein